MGLKFAKSVRRQINSEQKISILEVALSPHPASHSLSGLGFLHSLSFSGLEIHGVFLDFFNDRLLLNPSFESTQSAFQGFSIFDHDKSQ